MKQAETLNPYMLKGKQIAILGRLKQETWTDKSTGGNRSKVVIYAETIQLLQNIDGKGQNKPATQSSRLSGEIVPPEQFDDSMDIPF